MMFDLLTIGGIALLILLAIPAMVILSGMWAAWWLHPLYLDHIQVMFPALPILTYWQFVAVRWFISAAWPYHVSTTEPTESKTNWGLVGGVWLLAPLIYYLVLWALS